MLILLDENLSHKLRRLLGGHDVRTTVYQGWAGLTNGALLKAAEGVGFGVLDHSVLSEEPQLLFELVGIAAWVHS
jgi:hypothetical protein